MKQGPIISAYVKEMQATACVNDFNCIGSANKVSVYNIINELLQERK